MGKAVAHNEVPIEGAVGFGSVWLTNSPVKATLGEGAIQQLSKLDANELQMDCSFVMPLS